MAFATTNVMRENLGSINLVRGSWSGLGTDTTVGTFTGTGFAISADFQTNNSIGPENSIPCRLVNSSGTWTVSIPYSTDVTSGTFAIKFR